MLDITILSIGKVKNKHYQHAVNEYLKRLQPYARVKMKHLKAESFQSHHQHAQVREKEMTRVLQYLDKHSRAEVIILDEQGKQYSSMDLTQRIARINRPIIFVIGGALGHAQELLNKYQHHLSLSKLTFPHELAQVVLIEQLYRAATILQEKTYHY